MGHTKVRCKQAPAEEENGADGGGYGDAGGYGNENPAVNGGYDAPSAPAAGDSGWGAPAAPAAGGGDTWGGPAASGAAADYSSAW